MTVGGTFATCSKTRVKVPEWAIDPKNTQTVYAGTYGDGVFKSSDGGASWTEVNSGLRDLSWIESLAVSPKNTQVVYAGTSSDGVFKTTNGGLTNYDLADDPESCVDREE